MSDFINVLHGPSVGAAFSANVGMGMPWSKYGSAVTAALSLCNSEAFEVAGATMLI